MAGRIYLGVMIVQWAVIAALLGAVVWPQYSPICAHEYSTTCLWIGPLQGDGRGRIVWNP